MLMDNLGNLWDMYTWATDDGFSAELYHYETGMGQYGLTFPGNGNDMYCSLFASDYDNLFATVYTGDHSELYHYAYDYEIFGYVGKYLGSFGNDVWPAALTSGYVNNATGTDSVARRGEAMKLDAVKVSAEELASVKFESNTMTMVADPADAAVEEIVVNEIVFNEAVKTPVTVLPMAGSAVVADKEAYVTVTITAGAAEAAPATLSEELFTNGVTTVNWDTNALELVEIAMGADYTSINQGEGTATLGYVQLDGYAADDVVATLYFKVKNTDTESVTVIYEEINNDKLGIEETVAINYPHANTEVKDAKDATCTEEGYTGDTYCADCGKLIAKGEVIPATGHQNTEVKDAKDATCTEDGYTGDTWCNDCNTKIADGEVIPAHGHDFKNYVSDGNATCTEDGTKTAKCENCDATDTVVDEGSAKGHGETEVKDAKDATCTEDGYTGDTYCTVCGDKIADGEVIPAKGHGETEIKDAKDATCTEEGYTGDTYCTVCGDKIADGEVIPAKGHGETEIKDAKPATTTEEGYTGDTYCTDCGEKISEGESIPKVDPENPKTSETRAFLMATAAVMVAAAAAVVVMISRKKLF
jgi:hypothetical protein